MLYIRYPEEGALLLKVISSHSLKDSPTLGLIQQEKQQDVAG